MEDNTLTLQKLMSEARHRLATKYGEREATAMVDEMMLRLKGWNKVDTIIHWSESVTEYLANRVDETIGQLLAGKPIQYIFGKAHFYGMDFKVTPDTLIPRPETAQLVDMIADRYGKRRDLRVLDLGTGSGCIAISLGRHLPFAQYVTAVDKSEGALSVAQENAQALRVNVNFVQADMLDLTFAEHLDRQYDIIVSNPPYIAEYEAAKMDCNVLEHEPHTALFVPDDNPLLFYRAIADTAVKLLADGGTLFLEINPLFVSELTQMLREYGFNEVDIEKDMQQADRFIIAKR